MVSASCLLGASNIQQHITRSSCWRALCASSRASEISKNNPAAARRMEDWIASSLPRSPSLAELRRTSRSLQRRASHIENEPRPPPGELTEAAFYIAPRLEIAMRCGSSFSRLSLKGEGVCQVNGRESFCGLIPSLTLPFSRGGEKFRTSLFEHHLFRKPVAALRQRGASGLKIHALERQQDVGYLLAVARLLEVGDLAAAAIGDAGLRDL